MTKSFLQSDLLRSFNVNHGFFTKNGGYSSGLYSSLNCKMECDDKAENVNSNINRVAELLNFDISRLTLLRQTHSTKVIIANNSIKKIEGDAVFTNKIDHAIGVITADCVPILLYGANSKAIACIHAGWKGAYTGVIENAIKSFNDCGEYSIYAAIGPCIKQKNYEIDLNFYNKFIEQDDQNKIYFADTSKNHHFLFDLTKYCYDKLKKSGVKEIDDIDEDTYFNEKNFFSCRRAYHKKEKDFGCQISVIHKS
ncbi:MAG: YfiH family protein [Candidatus Midichloriaceae bacterium]|jgi:YfiH family protein